MPFLPQITLFCQGLGKNTKTKGDGAKWITDPLCPIFSEMFFGMMTTVYKAKSDLNQLTYVYIY